MSYTRVLYKFSPILLQISKKSHIGSAPIHLMTIISYGTRRPVVYSLRRILGLIILMEGCEVIGKLDIKVISGLWTKTFVHFPIFLRTIAITQNYCTSSKTLCSAWTAKSSTQLCLPQGPQLRSQGLQNTQLVTIASVRALAPLQPTLHTVRGPAWTT